MRRELVTLIAAAGVATAMLSACSGSGNQAPAGSPSAGTATGSAAPSAAQAHNAADVAFAQNMLPCHQQAIEMSDIIVGKPGIDPRVIQVANQIKPAEGADVQQFRVGWASGISR